METVCIVGNVDTSDLAACSYYVSSWSELIQENERYNLFYSTPSSSLVPSLPTMQRTHWVTSLDAIHQITCSFLRSHTGLCNTIFHTLYAAVISETCKHTFMFNKWWSNPLRISHHTYSIFFKQVDPSFWALFVGVVADNLSSGPPSKPQTTLMEASDEGSGNKMDFLGWRVYFLSE